MGLLFSTSYGQAQRTVQPYIDQQDEVNFTYDKDITANHVTASVVTTVIYNAVPDGYHITYTTSFMGNTLEDVENRMNARIDSLVQKAVQQKLIEKDVHVDITALDPIFDFNADPAARPIGYKITENITFHLSSISTMRELSALCLQFDIYDLIDAKAYVRNSRPIMDSLNRKNLEILEEKKRLCSEAGWVFSGGKTSLHHQREVFYPDERYLRSFIQSTNLFRHHISQTSNLNLKRSVDVDDYFNLNFKDADYIFNDNVTTPVVQFYHRLTYIYTKSDTEEEMRKKIREEEKKKQKNIFFMVDEEGNLQRLNK